MQQLLRRSTFMSRPRAQTLSPGEIAALVRENHHAVVAKFEAQQKKLDNLEERVRAADSLVLGVAQEVAARRDGFSGVRSIGIDPNSIGAQIAKSDQLAHFIKNGAQGKVAIKVQAAALTSSPSTAGSLIVPERQTDVVPLPRTALRLRQLLAPGTTASDLVQFPKMTGRTTTAAPVSEGATKPEAGLTWTLEQTPVATIATWIPASRQILADVPQLQSMVDNELRYMIALAEESQILYGDGTSPDLLGIIPQATDFAAPFAVAGGETDLDTVLQAKAQVETSSKLICDGIVMNPIRWARILSMKDGEGRYMAPGGAFSAGPGSLWGMPVVESQSIDEDHFLIGAFRQAAQIIDRQETTLYVSDSHEDFFIKNMIVLLMEERVALAVKRPDALVFGAFPSGTGT